MSDSQTLKDLLVMHEGSSRYAYQDSVGVLTIGIGRSISKERGLGLSMDEQLYLLDNDIARCRDELKRCNFYKDEPNVVRQDALVELCFNIGISSLLKFVKMICALESKDYKRASFELTNSKWASQVSKERVASIKYRLEHGVYP